MMTVVLSSAAQDDLRWVGEYIAVEVGNTEAAGEILRAIQGTMVMIARFPKMGKRCKDFEHYVPKLRSIGSGGYRIYYRIVDEIIEVGRIVHDRREQERAIVEWVSAL